MALSQTSGVSSRPPLPAFQPSVDVADGQAAFVALSGSLQFKNRFSGGNQNKAFQPKPQLGLSTQLDERSPSRQTPWEACESRQLLLPNSFFRSQGATVA